MKNRALNKYIYDSKRTKTQSMTARTYEGFIQGTNEPIYIKMVPIKTNCCSGSKALANEAVQEVEGFSKLKCQYITPLVEVAESHNHIYIVSGRGVVNLAECIDKIQSKKKIFEIFLDLVIGVCYLRSHGYIHCNLVPGVIELYETGAKIGGLDFCYPQKISQKWKKLEEVKNWLFMASQQLKNDKITQKTMIWNLGIILYLMVFKKLPYQARNKDELLHKMVYSRISFSQRITPFLEVILMGCLRPKTSTRFSLNQLLRYLLNNSEIQSMYEEVIKGKIGDLQSAYTLPQSEFVFQSQNREKQIDNEIGYMHFLERACFLVQKMEIKIQDLPIFSLTQFIIRCRFEKLKKSSYWKQNKINPQLKYSYQQFSQAYSKNLSDQHMKKLSKQKYHFFRFHTYKFQQIIYLQYQAFLRQYIQQIIKQILKIQPQLYLTIPYTIYALDFLISIFELCEDLITQNEEQNWRLLGHNYMRIFAQEPLKHNMAQILKNIFEKVRELRFMINEQ